MKHIPIYKGGKQSLKKYNAGPGFCDLRKIENANTIPYVYDEMKLTEPQFREILTKFDDDGIQFSFKYGFEGAPAVRIFYNQRFADMSFINGTLKIDFVDDYMPREKKDVFVTTYTETKADEYLSYISEIEKSGFEHSFSNKIEDNRYDEFITENGLLCTSYQNGTVRIMEDNVSLSVNKINEYDRAFGKSEVYQYGLSYGPNRGGYSCNCGMCYLVKFPDNSIMMIDGGYYTQASDDSLKGLFDLMKKISGEEKIRLNWFLTHYHDDHMDMFSKLLRVHHDKIDLQTVIFNSLTEEIIGLQLALQTVENRILKYYPNVKYRKIHAGDSFILGGCMIDILQTHEMSTGVVGDEIIGGANDTSTVVKFHLDPETTNGDTDFIVLGDLDSPAESYLIKAFSEKTLHSGLVQVAHHLFNKLDYLYDIIKADYALVPESEKSRRNHDSPKYMIVTRTVPEGNFYFAAEGTDGFRAENGKIVHFCHYPLIGGIYDGSQL